MADVYVARQGGPAGFDKIVAIKLLRDPGDGAGSGFRDMFLEEVRTAALLNHPSIVQTFDAGELGERLYMTMEFVNGETLGRFARAVAKTGGVFPCELALAIARDLANALDYAHTLTNLEGVPLQLVHRDVSPSNVLVSFDGMVKLLDFGIAKVATQLQMTGAGIIKGKFSYMSPEQAKGEHIDQRSDVYSLGLVLWQLLTGRPAFHADSDAALLRLVIAPKLIPPSQAGATCSEEVDELVMAALAPDPVDRYQTAAEFATAVARYMTRRAAGFDATKVIRGLMAAHFQERRERLAQLVRSSHREVSLSDVDHLAQQPSIRTPTPRVDPRGTGGVPAVNAAHTVNTVGTLDAASILPATVAPTTTLAPGARNRWQIGAILALLVVGAGYVTMRETAAPPVEPAPPREATATATMPATATTIVAALPGEPDASVAQPLAAAAAPIPAAAREPDPSMPSPPSPPPRRAVESRRDVRPRAPSRPAAAPPRAAAPAASPARPAVVAAPSLAAASDETPTITVVAPRDPPPPAPSPIDAGVSPAPGERRAPRVEPTGSFDAVPRVARISLDGSLPTSEIRNALDRVQSTLRTCYRSAAHRAARTPTLAIKVSFEIDEARAARSVRISGDTLGLAGCVGDALSGIRTRVAPDVGTVAVTAVIKFDPVED